MSSATPRQCLCQLGVKRPSSALSNFVVLSSNIIVPLLAFYKILNNMPVRNLWSVGMVLCVVRKKLDPFIGHMFNKRTPLQFYRAALCITRYRKSISVCPSSCPSFRPLLCHELSEVIATFPVILPYSRPTWKRSSLYVLSLYVLASVYSKER